ncbi:MAG: hypothetical protein FWB83_09130 [Treponema sp.]|nr:hypothetical protein [Treponema sp.]MCL2181278.1 hypothetical protein [Treponema sp.]
MTKRIIFLFTAIAAVFLFQSTSPWEGAAAVAPEGELPASGFFIATNSFPRNTVVDITNIESGRSTRVIVANTLNSPGLIAIVSREAAQLIGMRTGSVSRIRMLSPSDPIAYQRFAEGLASDIPSFDSGNVIRTEQELLDELYRDDTYRPPSVQPQTIPPGTNEFTGPSYVMEPEWGGTSPTGIVDIPRFDVPPIGPFNDTPAIVQEPVVVPTEREPVVVVPVPPAPVEPVVEEPVRVVEAEPVVEEPTPVEPVIEEPVRVVEAEPVVEEPAPVEPVVEPVRVVETEPAIEVIDDLIKDITDVRIETAQLDIVKDVPVFLPELPLDDTDKDVLPFTPDAERIAVVKDVPVYTPERSLEDIAKDLTEREEPAAPVPARPTTVQEPTVRPEFNIVEAEERTPQMTDIYGIDPSDIIPSIVVVTPPAAAVTPPVREPSLPLTPISSLERGQYYVQIAAVSAAEITSYSLPEGVMRFRPVVFRGADNLYRILIGPLNQGESAAVLQRFKSIGYRDAFVRHGG